MAHAQASLTQNGTAPVSVHLPAAISASVITPIVFCASLVPWASEPSDAHPIWPPRKPLSVQLAATPTVTRKISQVPTTPTRPAITGDITAGRITLPITPSSLAPSPFQLTPPHPSAANEAPIRPPNNACE